MEKFVCRAAITSGIQASLQWNASREFGCFVSVRVRVFRAFRGSFFLTFF